MFGSIADVLRYNIPSSRVAEIALRILGIQLTIYFDGFGALSVAKLAKKARSEFSPFSTRGVILKPSKSEAGSQIIFLGLRGHSPLIRERSSSFRNFD